MQVTCWQLADEFRTPLYMKKCVFLQSKKKQVTWKQKPTKTNNIELNQG